MMRLVLIASSSIIFLLGTWQIGHGAWIYIKAEVAQYLLEQAWEKTKVELHPIAPWPWADTWPVAKLIVPRHHIEVLVLSGASGRTLAFGPGHVSGTAEPGSMGTAILNGHRDTHFQFLQDLRAGDLMVIERSDATQMTFAISHMRVVDSRHTFIRHDESKSQLALVTCYPFNAIAPGGPLRYIVIAERLLS